MPRARTSSMGGCDVGGRRSGIGILPSRLFADSGKVFIGGLVAQRHVWDGFLLSGSAGREGGGRR